LTNNKIKNEVCFCVGNTTAKTVEENKIKNIVIAEIPIIEDVIVEVIAYYNTEESIEPSAKN
jgi:uroporphyrinogen-III synthase